MNQYPALNPQGLFYQPYYPQVTEQKTEETVELQEAETPVVEEPVAQEEQNLNPDIEAPNTFESLEPV